MKWQKILKLLAEESEPVSGERIGRELGITRASVWKYVNFLKEKGFVISSGANRGYSLMFPKDTPLILEHRDIGTKCFGATVVPKIDTASTNEDVISMARQNPEGTVVVTEHQTAGKGRKGRTWTSPFGKGIYCSILLKPPVPVAKIARLTVLTGVAVGMALKMFEIPVQLKWPNDIMIHGKKAGGILSESFIEGEDVSYVVIGMGINVNTAMKDFPGEIKKTAGSILTETGTILHRRTLLKEVLTKFEQYYYNFITSNGELNEVRKEWEAMAYGKDMPVMLTTGSTKERCRVIGLKEDGALLVDVDGFVKEVYAGEVL